MSHLIAVPVRPGLRLAGALRGAVVDRTRRWSVESQLAARRNAMVACTALAARRAERDAVEVYLREVPAAVRTSGTVVAHA